MFAASRRDQVRRLAKRRTSAGLRTLSTPATSSARPVTLNLCPRTVLSALLTSRSARSVAPGPGAALGEAEDVRGVEDVEHARDELGQARDLELVPAHRLVRAVHLARGSLQCKHAFLPSMEQSNLS